MRRPRLFASHRMPSLNSHAMPLSADGMMVVTRKKANKPKTKVPPMSEERIKEINEAMFNYNPFKNRRDPRINVRLLSFLMRGALVSAFVSVVGVLSHTAVKASMVAPFVT